VTSNQSKTQVIPVTADNFIRAESDMYFGRVVQQGGFSKFVHYREPMPIDRQIVVRANRDTLYSSAVFDLDAAPVTIALPDSGTRFRSMMIMDEDQYVPAVIYDAGIYTFTREKIGTRYMIAAVRTLVEPLDSRNLRQAHALQDAVKVNQQSPGKFEVPNWDPISQKKIRETLQTLGSTLPDLKRMFGTKDQVDPVRHLIGAAMGWGGNPDTEAVYLSVTPAKNDGTTIYKLRVKEVPVAGFWSISVYNAQGHFEPNAFNAYTLNNITAKTGLDGSIDVQFGGADGKIPNCLPIVKGWNYMVRLYRPRPEILNGQWSFPEAQQAETRVPKAS
jgi:hypothetical protein